MRIKTIISLFIVLGLVFNVNTILAQQIKEAQIPILNKASYEQKVKAGLDGKVKGWAAVLIQSGTVKSQLAGGMARNIGDGDGIHPMLVTTPANIGSTAKFLSGVALLDLFEKKKEKTVNQWLDQKMYLYLPEIWQAGVHESVKNITFRHLLTHTSGLPASNKTLLERLGQDVSAGFDKRSYQNINFTLLTYLIPSVADYYWMHNFNVQIDNASWKAKDPEIIKRLGNRYEEYMRTKVFNKTVEPIKPSCDPAKELDSFAYIYASASDAAKGSVWSERDENGACHAQGGWYISARELASFVATFSATENLVTKATREMMFDDDNSFNAAMVWSFPINDSWYQTKFGFNPLPFMGGDAPVNNGAAHATIVMLPNGYYAVAIINSNDMNSTALTKILTDAFKNSIS